MNSKVDAYIDKSQKWSKEIGQLRRIILDCGLTEEFKWRSPCYSYQENNIVLIHTFKEYCALLFFKGVLLKDTHKMLVQQTKNVQSARQIRFTQLKEIEEKEREIKTYVYEAIEAEKAGLKVEFKKTTEFEMPKEFQQKLTESPDLKKAFYSLTPGRQRAYLLHFSGAKQEKTREARIEKCQDKIMNGKGLNDR